MCTQGQMLQNLAWQNTRTHNRMFMHTLFHVPFFFLFHEQSVKHFNYDNPQRPTNREKEASIIFHV